MSFLKHVGKVGDRKVAVLFREVPSEPHMCLVTYTETLNTHIHDPIMAAIESQIGQTSENLADALNRTYTKDGKIILQVLHSQGLIKKVPTAQVMMTPSSTTFIRLEELNKILNEMKQGEDAVRRLAEIDASRGLQDPADVARRMREMNNPPPVTSAADGLLGDRQLAQQRLAQAERMEREANGLIAEARRLKEEAQSMDPSLAVATQPTVTVQKADETGQKTPAKRGRPAKATQTA
jgi:hypothetical protein